MQNIRIRTPEAYKEANEFSKELKWTQVEQKNSSFLDLKFDRNKKRQEADSSGKKYFLPECLVLFRLFQNFSKHALRILIGWNLQPV